METKPLSDFDPKPGEKFICVDGLGMGEYTPGKAYEITEDGGIVDDDGDASAVWQIDVSLFKREATSGEADVVQKPSHYARLTIEPLAYILRNGFEFWRGNPIKYISRAGHKLYPGKNETESEIIDLEKAIRCCEARINLLKGETTL